MHSVVVAAVVIGCTLYWYVKVRAAMNSVDEGISQVMGHCGCRWVPFGDGGRGMMQYCPVHEKTRFERG